MSSERLRRLLAAGEVLFREGERGDEAYVIESGRVEIYTGESTTRRVVACLGRDDLFGEMALVGDQRRSASAVALEPTALITVTHGYLEERLQAAEPLLRHLLRVAIGRSRDSLRGAGLATPRAGTESDPDGLEARSAALQRLRIEQALAGALEPSPAGSEFELQLQPILRLHDGRPAGFEALIRWQRADGTRVSPGEFIPIAEQSALIVPLGHWIIRSACAALAGLDRAYPEHELFMSLNLSIRQFGDPQLLPVLSEAMQTHAIAPQRLRLEITESMLAHDTEGALHLLRHCKSLGAKLSVDDFGTGYSSLSYLQRFPVDSIKLDRSFIAEIEASVAAQKIVGAVSRLASELGVETIAEGIETPAQAALCRELGVDYGQGFLYARPLAAAELPDFLARPAQVF